MNFDVTDVKLEDAEIIAGPEGAFAYMFNKGPFEGISYAYTDIVVDDVESEDGSLGIHYALDILSNFNNVEYDMADLESRTSEILEILLHHAISVLDAANIDEGDTQDV